ncbi:MAG: ABC transporter ATP-binding protein [Candidatus Kapaibacterium sp.]
MIKITNLKKSYDGGIEALNGVSFDINPSEITGYIGVNGAGKTTTLKILSGVIPFDEGEVIVNDYRLPEDALKIKSITGYVPETPELFNSLRVTEYFDFLKDVREIEENKFLKRVEYFGELFDFKDYLNTAIGKLSKGNKQKVLIVSALLHNPDIILLDEPLNGLDAYSIITFQDVISKLAQRGKTIFYCSHLLDIMEKVSDRVIIIESGKIKINSSKEELKSNNDFKSLENIFRDMNEAGSKKEFSYDEIFD